MELKIMMDKVRELRPLVHCITNNVTINDCAQILLMAGAAPIMATAIEEMEEMVGNVDALCVNIGTLTNAVIPSMLVAARTARKVGCPAVLDPVGVGATALRTRTARQLMAEAGFSLLRGNASEILALAGRPASTRGTDAGTSDLVDEQGLVALAAFAKEFAGESGSVVGISGPIDVVADADHVFLVRNGHPIMTRISGTGCMLSSLCAAFLGVNRGKPLEASIAAFCAMGVCGEKAATALAPGEGPMAWRTRFLDSLAQLTGDELEANASYDEI